MNAPSSPSGQSGNLAIGQEIALQGYTDAGGRGLWGDALRRLLANRLAIVGLVVISFVVVVAVFAPLIAPFDPAEQDLTNTFAKPDREHLMGTDNLGRDWFSRLVYGARISMTVGFFAQAVILAIGMTIGVLAGYFGGWVDNIAMRFTDLMYAFPDLLFIILLRSVFGGNIFVLFVIIGLVSWVDVARLVRAQILSLKEREFVEAARALGATNRALMWRHLLPNTLSPVIIVVAFGIPRAIFTEAALSFIGIGVDPRTPSWGSMIYEGYGGIFAVPSLVLFPAVTIAIVMLSFQFVGDGLRDALDPRTR
jgi:oligopeptide transport system permease protein